MTPLIRDVNMAREIQFSSQMDKANFVLINIRLSEDDPPMPSPI